jgi:hypothetical protein
MKIRGLALIAALFAVLGGSAAAASFALQPGALVLRKSDFPARATYNSGRMPANFTKALAAVGVKANGAYFSVTIPAGGAAKYQSVDGLVVTTGSAAQAKSAYRLFKSDLDRRSKSLLQLPAYGDEQLALYQSPRVGSKAELLVRRNRVVWQVEVGGGGLLAIPKSTLVGELRKYAAKQKARIGAG